MRYATIFFLVIAFCAAGCSQTGAFRAQQRGYYRGGPVAGPGVSQQEPVFKVGASLGGVFGTTSEAVDGFSDSEFEHSQSIEVLDENASVILSHMKKAGWLQITLHPEDSRKRIYRLKSPEKAIQDMAHEKE